MARYDAGHDNEGGLARHATQFEFKYAKAVARLLQDGDKEVRRAAAVTLGQMGARGAEYNTRSMGRNVRLTGAVADNL